MTRPAIIRILIVDEHDGVRLGLTTALAIADDIVVAGQAADGQDALALCEQVQPDVVLMDIQLPGRNGVDIIAQIRRQFPSTRIVILTTAPAMDLKRQAESAGASVYLQKYIAADALIEAIRTVHTAISTGLQAGEQQPTTHPGRP